MCLSGLAWGLMKKAVTIGASSASSNNPVHGAGDAILGFGGENIQDMGSNNILGIGPLIQ